MGARSAQQAGCWYVAVWHSNPQRVGPLAAGVGQRVPTSLRFLVFRIFVPDLWNFRGPLFSLKISSGLHFARSMPPIGACHLDCFRTCNAPLNGFHKMRSAFGPERSPLGAVNGLRMAVAGSLMAVHVSKSVVVC